MKRFVLSCVCAAALLCAWTAAAQSASGTVPQLLNFSGQVLTAGGAAKTGPALLTIALYDSQTGGTPLWSEQQAVTLDAQGRYAVILGALTQGGVPVNVFVAGSARWMGIAVDAEPEQPRFMLLSVAYALKAADADTVGGKTPSDFVLTTNLTEKVRDVVSGRASADGPTTQAIGTANYLQKGNGSGGTTDTVAPVFEDNSGRMGIGTTTPTASLDVAAFSPEALVRINSGSAGNAAITVQNDNPTHNFHILAGGTTMAGTLFGVNRADSAQFYVNAMPLVLGTGSALPLTLGTAALPRITVDPGGNVGIGTTSPTTKLHVVGNAFIDGTLTGTNIQAQYQDVAEWVEASPDVDAGTVVIVDPKHPNRVVPAPKAYDARVAGAVSRQPGIVLGEKSATKAIVAQSGRVRIKADARYGAIRIGDLLVTSPTPGYAMRSHPLKVGGQTLHRPGTLLGKALEALPNGKGEILVLLTLQ